MANNKELVTEFRQIIDETIAAQVQRDHSSWLGMDTTVTDGDLRYEKVEANSGRLGIADTGANAYWEMTQHNQSFEHFAGSIAIVSVEGQDDSLIRAWSFTDPLLKEMFGIRTQRQIETEDEVEMAVRWARAPFRSGRLLGRLGLLEPGELKQIEEQYAKSSDQADRLATDLINLQRQRNMAIDDRSYGRSPRIR